MSIERVRYGEGPRCFGDLYRDPDGGARGTVVLIHGGFWRARFSLERLEPAAADLLGRGFAVWNLEYRRVGQGPWPSTLDDVAAGVDHLAALDVTPPFVLVGHSAGGHLAVWAAGRDGGAVPVAGAVSLAGVLDLAGAARDRIGEDAAREFVGGGPDDFPERYAAADPLARVPIGVPVRCVHAPADDRVPHAQSQRYVAAARAAGDDATLHTVPGDHFTVADPTAPAWDTVLGSIGGAQPGVTPRASRRNATCRRSRFSATTSCGVMCVTPESGSTVCPRPAASSADDRRSVCAATTLSSASPWMISSGGVGASVRAASSSRDDRA